MPSTRKNRRKKFQSVSRNKKSIKRKLKKQKSANIQSKQIKNSWNPSKTIKQNLDEMGLAFDPNKAMPIQRKLPHPQIITDDFAIKVPVKNMDVIKAMEVEANAGERKKKEKLPADDVLFCTTLLDKYKDDYKAMARDRTNHYQLTPKQIRDKIRKFKRCKSQYQAYLDSKACKENNVTNDVEMSS